MKKTTLNCFKLTLCIAFVFLTGCATTATQEKVAMSKNMDAYFVHTVFFWLEEGTSAAERLKFENDLANLASSNENVQGFHLGYPAQTPRSVVDNSYDLCYVATFDSKEGQDLYQIDPLHTQFVEDHKAIWKKVVVYDSITK